MRCEAAERELSARLDGDRDRRLDLDLVAHVDTCPRCRAFGRGAGRVRDLTRLQPAEPVPDLVPDIMARIRGPDGHRGLRRRPVPPWARYAAAFAAGAVAAALAVGGLPGVRGPSPALATQIPDRIAAASSAVTSYRATFRIVERGFHLRVPRRTFEARVSFLAPERFRAVVTDTTPYPSPAWPAGDLRLEVDGDRWVLDGPPACPREGLPACAAGRRLVRIEGREPFDGDAPLPTDIVLPVSTLAGTDRVRVIGEGTLLDRDAVTVELSYRDATPLFAYLQAGGSWRPFFPQDRVLLSLDAESWFPLAYEVRAAASPERERWAMRNALPSDPGGSLLFRAEATALETGPVRLAPLPAFSGPATDMGFRDRSIDELEAFTGTRPLLPAELEGLAPYRSGTFEGGGRPADEMLLSFTRGLAWLKVRETRTWAQPSLFGDVGPLAEPVRLGEGTGYYEPATSTLGRRISIHARGWDLSVETNLPRSALLRIAASLPVRGLPAPRAWTDRITLDAALERAPFLLVPTRLPEGYRLWAAQPADGGVTLSFRRPGTELDGVGIRLHQSRGMELSPPLEPDVLAVRVRNVVGRYSPDRGELEWIEDGIYRSLSGSALDLAGLLRVAGSLKAPR